MGSEGRDNGEEKIAEVSYRRFPDINRRVLTELLPNRSFISRSPRKRILELFSPLSMLLHEILRSVVDTNDYTSRYTVAPCRGLARSIRQIAPASFSPVPDAPRSVPRRVWTDIFETIELRDQETTRRILAIL